MMTAREVLSALDGSDSVHAHGRADDLHRVLDLLGDADRRERCAIYLTSTIIHQGTPWPVTARVGDALAACLSLPDAAGAREAILDFLAEVVDAAVSAGASEQAVAQLSATIPDRTGAQERWERLLSTGSESFDEAYTALLGDERFATYVMALAFEGVVNSRVAWAVAAWPLIADMDGDVALSAAQVVVMADPDRTLPQAQEDARKLLTVVAEDHDDPEARRFARDLLRRFL